MSRLEAAFFAAVSLAAWTCLGQTPDVLGGNSNQEDLERLLALGPREVAWAAYTIARENRREMVSSLASLIASYPGEPIPARARARATLTSHALGTAQGRCCAATLGFLR